MLKFQSKTESPTNTAGQNKTKGDPEGGSRDARYRKDTENAGKYGIHTWQSANEQNTDWGLYRVDNQQVNMTINDYNVMSW